MNWAVSCGDWCRRHSPILAVLFLALLLRLGTLGYATNVDEGDYLLQGREITRGHWPHADVHLNKPPLVSFLGLPFFLAFDVPIIPVRVFMILLSLSALAAAYWLGSELWDRRAGLCAASLLAFDPFFAIWSKYLHVSTVTPILSLWAVTLLIAGFHHRRGYLVILSGVVAALCGFNKQTGVLILPILIAIAFLKCKQLPTGKVLGWFLLGLLPLPVAFMLWLTVMGAWEPFIYDVWYGNLAMGHVFDFSSLRRWMEFRVVTHWNPLGWCLAVLGFVYVLFKRDAVGCVIGAWGLMEFGLNIFGLSHVWQHYVMAIMPAAYLLGGLALARSVESVPVWKGRERWLGPLLATLTLLVTALYWSRANWAYPNMTLEDERGFAVMMDRMTDEPMMLCFVNTSYYIWTSKDVPPSVRGDRHVRIPPFMNTAARGYLSLDDMRKTAELWEKQPFDTCFMYDKYYRQIFIEKDPLLEPIRVFFENRFELRPPLAKNLPTYYAHMMVLQRKTPVQK